MKWLERFDMGDLWAILVWIASVSLVGGVTLFVVSEVLS